ncbi:MAG: Anti-sigma-W factor RsiW [Syntrophomonadaceae bacterium]|nr:Anti-sigma-W factor RsiW [Bacillota bacterium]
MTCRQARRLFGEYLENLLTEQESTVLRNHLAACPNCSREAAKLQSALSFVRQAKPPALPQDFRQNVLRQIECDKTAARKQWSVPRNMPAMAAAAAVFIMLLAGNLLLTVLPASRLAADAPEPRAQMKTILQESVKMQQPQPAPEPPETPPGDTTFRQQGELRLAEDAMQANDAGAKAEFLQDRTPAIRRLLLNAFLIPLFILLLWRAVKKRRVV